MSGAKNLKQNHTITTCATRPIQRPIQSIGHDRILLSNWMVNFDNHFSTSARCVDQAQLHNRAMVSLGKHNLYRNVLRNVEDIAILYSRSRLLGKECGNQAMPHKSVYKLLTQT